jgi:hypothetical protein
MAEEKRSPNRDAAPPPQAAVTDETPEAPEARAKKTAELRKERASLRAERKASDEKPVYVEITHGTYVDHKTYHRDDPENPPAQVGDVIEVPARVAQRLVADKVAKIAA